MESISIQTSQNIAIEQPIASIGERIAATMLDFIFFSGYLVIIGFISSISFHEPFLFGILAIPLVFYHPLSELLMNGQSWGKKILKIKVAKTDGTETGFFAYFIRWIFRLIDIAFLFGGIATFSIILNKKGQRLGDMAANTIVIRIKENNSGSTLYTKLPENYSLNYPEVKKLLDTDIYTVKEVLNFIESSHRSNDAIMIADKTKKALEKKMGIVAGIRSEHFLFKILRDYNHIHSS